MDNSKAPPFPNVAAYGRPHAWYGKPLQPGYNNYVAPHPFHDYKMAYARNEVINRMKQKAQAKKLYQVGGYRNLRQKPQPQGSFIMPFSVAGSNAYGYGSNIGAGYTGGYRTREGYAEGRQLLRNRASQLREMEMAEATGLPMDRLPSEAVQPVPLDRASEDYVAFQLLFSEIETQYSAGGFVRVPPSEVRKLFALFRKIYGEISKSELEDLYERTYEIVQSIANTLPQEQEEGDQMAIADLQAIYIGLYKLLALIKVSIAGINKQPAERKRFMNSFVKEILKTRGRTIEENVDNTTRAIDKALEVLEGVPNYVEPSLVGLPVSLGNAASTLPRSDIRGDSLGYWGEDEASQPSFEEGESGEGEAGNGYGDRFTMNPTRFQVGSLADYSPYVLGLTSAASAPPILPPSAPLSVAPSSVAATGSVKSIGTPEISNLTFIQLSTLAKRLKGEGQIPSNVRITGISKSELLKRIRKHI